MEWYVGLTGRPFGELEAEKRNLINRSVPATDEGWISVANAALEIIGMRQAVRVGDPKAWRQAVSELDTLPLAPLNLPLAVWELYNAHSYEAVKLRLKNSEIVNVPDWSLLFYCWHFRRFALMEDGVVRFFEAEHVVSAECDRLPTSQTTILEQLQWLESSTTAVTFVIRTREGQAFLVEGKHRFCLDAATLLVAIRFGEDQPLEMIRLADIAAIVLPTTEPQMCISKLQEHLKASPFRPLQIILLQGRRYTINRATDVLITPNRLYLGEGNSDVHTNVISIPVHWIDRLEVLPGSEPTKEAKQGA